MWDEMSVVVTQGCCNKTAVIEEEVFILEVV